jgi:drug/metabolite transporter (DMT)-like permease
VQLALNRKLGVISPPLITACAGAVCAALVLTPLLPGSWQPIPEDAWFYIGVLVVSGAVNQVLLVYAFAHADASTLAPFTYFEIVSAVIFGYLFFSTMPTMMSWMGIALIVVGGIYVSNALRMRNISRRGTRI